MRNFFSRLLAAKAEEHRLEKELGAVLEHGFREWSRLNKQEPVEKDRGELLGHVLIALVGGNNVKNYESCKAIRMVEGHAMSDAASPIMPHHREFAESQMLHHFHLVLSHGSLRISEVICAARGFAAIAVAAKVRNHEGEILRQQRRHFAPKPLPFR